MNSNADTNNNQRVKSSFGNETAFSRFAMLHHSGKHADLLSFNRKTGLFSYSNSIDQSKGLNVDQLLISIPDIQCTLVPNTLFDADSTSVFLSGQLTETPSHLVARYVEINSLHATLVYGVDAHLLSKLESEYPSAYITVPAESLLNHWSMLSKKTEFHTFTAVHWFKDHVYVSLWKDRKIQVFTRQNITTPEDIAYFTFNVIEQYMQGDAVGQLVMGGDPIHEKASAILSGYHPSTKKDSFSISTPGFPVDPELDNGEHIHLLSLMLCA